MAAFLIVFFAFVIFTCIYLYKLSTLKPKHFPPGPPSLPIWGGYWFLLLANYKFTHKAIEVLAKRYKSNIIGFLAGKDPVVLVTGYELVKEVLTRDEFIGRPDTYNTRERSGGERRGIFFIDGHRWKEQRRFSLRQLRDFGFGRRYSVTEQLFEGEIKALIESMNTTPCPDDYDVHCKKGRVLVPDLFFGLLSNAVLPMLVGKKFENKQLREMARSTIRFLRNSDTTGRALGITPWLKHIAPEYFGETALHVENKLLEDLFLKLVEDRKKTFSDDHHGDFLDSYLGKMQKLEQKGVSDSSFTQDQLVWCLADFFFPAANATGPALNMLWAQLCNRPQFQVKIQEEIDRVVGRSRLPNLDDKKNMPYVEAVIRESMRMDPVLPINTPRTCTEDTMLGGYFIPKSSLMLLSQWGAHYDPTVWENPEEFRPERFLDSDGSLLKRDYTIPFGAGKRLCAGETFSRNTMFLITSALLQNFTFEAVGGPPNLDKKEWGLVCDLPSYWVDAISR